MCSAANWLRAGKYQSGLSHEDHIRKLRGRPTRIIDKIEMDLGQPISVLDHYSPPSGRADCNAAAACAFLKSHTVSKN